MSERESAHTTFPLTLICSFLTRHISIFLTKEDGPHTGGIENKVKSSLIKKEKEIFLIYKEIQKGPVAKSYMTTDLLTYSMVQHLRISSYIRKPFLIYDVAADPI